MPRISRSECSLGTYHVYARGVEKRDIYRDERDFRVFLSKCKELSKLCDFKLYSYCLMSNHYHLQIHTKKANLSEIMLKLNGGYARYFNKKYERVGPLFQGRFQSKLIDSDNYNLYLSKYIHLNPVKAGVVDKPNEWLWSSYSHYFNCLKDNDFLDTEFILCSINDDLDTARRLYQEFINQPQIENLTS